MLKKQKKNYRKFEDYVYDLLRGFVYDFLEKDSENVQLFQTKKKLSNIIKSF